MLSMREKWYLVVVEYARKSVGRGGHEGEPQIIIIWLCVCVCQLMEARRGGGF